MRLVSYSSGYDPCGVKDYNRHLEHAMRPFAEMTTLRYPTERIGRGRWRELRAFRRRYVELAAESDEHDVALVHFASKYWNGGRRIENMMPVFLDRIRRPMIMVMHEWPSLPPEHHTGSWPLRLAKTAAIAAVVARDLGIARYDDWIERRMFARMSHIIVHTPELRDRLLATGYAPERVTSLPFPLHDLALPSTTPEAMTARFGLRGKRVLLLLGQPVERKGFELAVRALPSLPPSDVLLLVCSERDATERANVDRVREAAKAAGVADRLITTGYLDDGELASLFPLVTLALAPFTSVSGSSSIANFFSAGIPVITTDLPPMRQARSEGAGVILVPAGDADALAKAIRETSPDELARLRAANATYAAAHTFTRLAERIRDLADQVAAR